MDSAPEPTTSSASASSKPRSGFARWWEEDTVTVGQLLVALCIVTLLMVVGSFIVSLVQGEQDRSDVKERDAAALRAADGYARAHQDSYAGLTVAFIDSQVDGIKKTLSGIDESEKASDGDAYLRISDEGRRVTFCSVWGGNGTVHCAAKDVRGPASEWMTYAGSMGGAARKLRD